MDKLLELTGPRTIAMKDKGWPYSFTIRQITERDWLRYFDGIDSRSKRVGKEVRSTTDADTPMLSLIGEVLISATGYADGALTKDGNRRQKINQGHSMWLGQVLLDAEAIDDPLDGPEALGVERVALRAAWGSDEKGRLLSFKPLVHRFATPSFDQYRRYKRDQSQTVVVGGSRTGETIFKGWQRTLIELYDELIQDVEGYAVSGVALASQAEARAHMDAYHKVVAMQQVFRAPQAEEAEAAEEGNEVA